ncbi:hypothetical protein KM546_gp02 [Porcine lymphotropic herpesvirus 3]|uniref:Uncharacterized protein n=2 Tax=Macavirus suidgamma5 TaxID=3050359 RepID=Q772V3_9GAMA|nr:hypothetical protein KM546_gp02 [Porcine lymphotropic herpesvirus 3]AAO12295.1 unknown [Porcine lymphotropic herpesvirus 3]AAO12309.1 unknown [Porcine lymphotropic herpesvirus 3]
MQGFRPWSVLYGFTSLVFFDRRNIFFMCAFFNILDVKILGSLRDCLFLHLIYTPMNLVGILWGNDTSGICIRKGLSGEKVTLPAGYTLFLLRKDLKL